MILHIWNPSELATVLLEQFLVNAGPSLRRHALILAGNQAASAIAKGKGDEYERALSYWSDRLAKATSFAEPENFHQEIGAFGQWFVHDVIHDDWLVKQLERMVREGFVPMQSLLVMKRLAKMVLTHSELVASIILGLLKNPRTDRWMFLDREPIQTIFQGLLSEASTQSQAQEAISILASRGDTSFVALVPTHLTNAQ